MKNQYWPLIPKKQATLWATLGMLPAETPPAPQSSSTEKSAETLESGLDMRAPIAVVLSPSAEHLAGYHRLLDGQTSVTSVSSSNQLYTPPSYLLLKGDDIQSRFRRFPAIALMVPRQHFLVLSDQQK